MLFKFGVVVGSDCTCIVLHEWVRLIILSREFLHITPHWIAVGFNTRKKSLMNLSGLKRVVQQRARDQSWYAWYKRKKGSIWKDLSTRPAGTYSKSKFGVDKVTPGKARPCLLIAHWNIQKLVYVLHVQFCYLVMDDFIRSKCPRVLTFHHWISEV